MTCKELVELVTDYLDGALAEEDRRRFEHHIELCACCELYVEQMKVTIRTVGRIPEDSLSDEARAALLAAFSDWSGGERPLPARPE
jgi:anti-sigma factor RsiW